jgi:membrane protease subunit HflK
MATTEQEQKQDTNQTTADLSGREMDTGAKALSDALRISFNILRLIMVVLVVILIALQFFTVKPDEQALVLRFGKIRGVGEGRLLQPGPHWAMVPLEEVVRIPVKKVQMMPIDSFWYFQTEEEKLSGKPTPVPASQPLNPLKDGYSLTRNDTTGGIGGNDYNIVHSKWQLTYTIKDPELFFKNIWVKQTMPGQTYSDVLSQSVAPLLQSQASDAIIATMVHYSIDDVIRSKSEIAANVASLLQRKLDAIGSGIKVDGMQLTQATWPRQVDDAFVASIKASQESEKLVSEAKGYAENTLNEAGGPVVHEILAQLKNPTISAAEQEKLWSQLAGSAQEQIAQARAYRTSVVESAKANADYLRTILPEYQKRPQLVLQKIYQDTVENVLDNSDEKIILQPSAGKTREVRIQINRDPKAKPKVEEKK